jgi:hypothetical protein
MKEDGWKWEFHGFSKIGGYQVLHRVPQLAKNEKRTSFIPVFRTSIGMRSLHVERDFGTQIYAYAIYLHGWSTAAVVPLLRPSAWHTADHERGNLSHLQTPGGRVALLGAMESPSTVPAPGVI